MRTCFGATWEEASHYFYTQNSWISPGTVVLFCLIKKKHYEPSSISRYREGCGSHKHELMGTDSPGALPHQTFQGTSYRKQSHASI